MCAKQGTEIGNTYGTGRPARLPEAKIWEKKIACHSASESVLPGTLDQIFRGLINLQNVFSDAEVLKI